jgi:hypothetical protein
MPANEPFPKTAPGLRSASRNKRPEPLSDECAVFVERTEVRERNGIFEPKQEAFARLTLAVTSD